MPSGARTGSSFLIMVSAMALAASVLIILSLGASGEGVVLVNLGDDITTQEDFTVDFTPWVSYTGTKGLAYLWDFDDGTSSSNDNPSHKYTKAGDYEVTLTVTDEDGVSDSDSMVVSVLNVRPIADAGTDRTVVEGTSVTFDASGSWDTPSDLPLLTYEWDFGDGTGSTGASKDNKVVTHEYAENGVYIVRLVVRDDDWTDSNYATFYSQLISVTGTGSGGGTLSFTFGGNSTSNSSSSNTSFGYSFYWDFGDGNYAEGSSASHTYDSDGLYIVTLIVTDAFGAMSVHHILVTVLNSPPTATAPSDVSAVEDEEISFVGQGSDPGGGFVTYGWDFGDGTTGAGKVATHAYTKRGTYTVTLTVTDSDGDSDTDTCVATVTNVPPTAGLTSSQNTEEGDVIAFYGSTSTDTPSDLPLLTYAWSFGDGTSGSGVEVSHTYVDEGTFTVTLTVTDDDGATGTATMTVPVQNAAPVPNIDSVTCPADPILPLDNITFSGSATDKGANDVLSYSWSFGDDATATGTSVTHNYTSAGTYTVRLTVTDNDGGVGTVTTTVVVESLGDAAEEGQDTVDEAPSSSFSKAQDQALISEKFDDLLAAIAEGDANKVDARIHVLEVQIGNKVTDEDLKAQLLELLDNIEDSVG